MSKQRRQHRSDYKFKIALGAAKGIRTLAEISVRPQCELPGLARDLLSGSG